MKKKSFSRLVGTDSVHAKCPLNVLVHSDTHTHTHHHWISSSFSHSQSVFVHSQHSSCFVRIIKKLFELNQSAKLDSQTTLYLQSGTHHSVCGTYQLLFLTKFANCSLQASYFCCCLINLESNNRYHLNHMLYNVLICCTFAQLAMNLQQEFLLLLCVKSAQVCYWLSVVNAVYCSRLQG